MAHQTSMFKLGLFVLIGFLVLAAAIVWIGSHDDVKGGYYYVTYFAESVQGVGKSSPVKYQGIDVGKVVNIDVAPDPQLIEVTMSITAERALGQAVMAGIAIRGITGLAYIELLPQDAATVSKSPRIDFPTPYPVIPSYSRGISQVISSVGITLDNLSHVDFAALGQQAGRLMDTFQIILDGDDLKDTLGSLRRSAENLELFSTAMVSLSRELRAKELAGKLHSAVDDGKAITAGLRRQLDQLNLEDAGATLAQLTESLTEISSKLTYFFANLNALSERLAHSPSDIVFSNPPPPRPEERRRE